MVMFCKKQNVKKIGEVVLGFGILFMGLRIMGESMEAVKESPQILEFLSSLTSPFTAILVGFIITAILQSSSATVGIILLMVSQRLLAFDICPFIILGCNIGSCVSAILVSLSGKKDAKRAAMIHFIFNVIGSLIMFVILLVAIGPITDALLAMSGGNLARAVANVHTLMKVFEVLLLFPFMGWIVKLACKVVPGKDAAPEDEYELLYIGRGTMIVPTTAFANGIHEIEHMAKAAIENLKISMKTLCDPKEEEIEEVYRKENYIDFLNRKITDYLVKINEMDLPFEDSRQMGGLFHVVNDIERIGDHAENFADSAKDRIERGIVFSEKATKQLQDMTADVITLLEYSLDMFTNKNQEHMQEILELEDNIDEKERKMQRSHVKRLTKNKCTPEAGMLFSDTVSGLERVADHATNIAFSLLGIDPDYPDEEEED